MMRSKVIRYRADRTTGGSALRRTTHVAQSGASFSMRSRSGRQQLKGVG